MPKLKPDTQGARREHILDAAERCFARAGFHRCTMHDICREAGVSPGALYVYFSSKEALIAGIAERDRSRLAGELGDLSKSPDLLAALGQLGEHYAVEEPHHKRVLCMEIAVESTRNEAVGEIFRSVDSFVLDSFEALFAKAQADGRIAPKHDVRTVAQVLAVLGDGMFWRRAIDPSFDGREIMPVIMELVGALLNSQPGEMPPETPRAPSEAVA
jgi:AcrR family transcriptional regulator